jgi:hypothetical protein
MAAKTPRPGGRRWIRLALGLTISVWFSLLVLTFVGAGSLDMPQVPGEGETAQMEDLRLVGPDLDGEARPVYEWPRAQAIDFGMKQLVERLKFFVVAAAAAVAFLLRWLVGSPKEGRPDPLDLTGLVLVTSAVCGMFVSMVWGVLGHHYLIDVSTLEAFSIYDETRVCVLF